MYSFTTVEPGCPTGSTSAPFFACLVFARGLTDKLHTRIYLPAPVGSHAGDTLAADPLLSSLPAERRTTLMATREPDGSLHHDFHLQGPEETVFLDFG